MAKRSDLAVVIQWYSTILGAVLWRNFFFPLYSSTTIVNEVYSHDNLHILEHLLQMLRRTIHTEKSVL